MGYPNWTLPLERSKIKDIYKLSKFIWSKASAVMELLYPPLVDQDIEKDDKGEEDEADT